MPLPFLNKSKEASTSAPVEPVRRKPDNEEEYDGLHACAEDLKQALDEGDTKAIASALRAAFEILDSEPHEEGPHTESGE